MKNKIKLIIEKSNKFFNNPEFPFELIQETISEIQGLPISERSQLVEIYKKIGQELFNRGVGVKNYNLDAFLQEIEDWKKGKKEEKKPEKKSDIEAKLNIFIDCIKSVINSLRRNIILQIGRNPNFITKIFLLYDQYSYSPFLNSIKNNLQDSCEILEIQEFREKLKERDFKKYNFILLLMFSTGFKSGEVGIGLINELSGFFNNDIWRVIITDFEQKKTIRIENLEQIKEEINYLVGTDLSNRQLTPDKEKIIKKLFKDENCHVIDYNLINEGFSGADVYEVQPFKYSVGGTKYVIKINDINNEKLKNEKKNFSEYIKSYDSNYHCEEETTERLRAIKYGYASSDGLLESEAFARKLDLPVIDLSLVDKLFSIPLFNNWSIYKEKKKIIIKTYYEQYIDIEKIKQEICSIKNLTEIEIEKEELIININKILSAEVPVCLKICHGDLHTQNIYIDRNNKVFLIDFGDTKIHHAVIDHVTLECSIKFKHIPKYMLIKELEEVENNFLNKESFNPGFELNFINRSNIKSYFQLINNIRVSANRYVYDKNSKIDYFISLLMITFRQIKYQGLNQLYALHSAKILSDDIVQELNL